MIEVIRLFRGEEQLWALGFLYEMCVLLMKRTIRCE